MSSNQTRLFFLAIIVFLATIVLVSLFKQWGFPDTQFPLNKGEKIKLGEEGVRQTFKIDRNGLSGINILFGGSQIDNGGTLSIALLDESCREKIAEETRFTDSLDTKNSFRFSFSPISNSKGKIFCLTIRFSPEKGSKKAAIFVTSNTIPEKALALSINGETRPNESLALRPVYKNKSIFADLVELDQRISQYKPWFLKGALLAGIAILSLALTFSFLILIITPSSDQNRETK